MITMCRAVIAIRAARVLLPWPSWLYPRILRLPTLASLHMALGALSWRRHPVGVPLPPRWLQETLRAPRARASWYTWARWLTHLETLRAPRARASWYPWAGWLTRLARVFLSWTENSRRNRALNPATPGSKPGQPGLSLRGFWSLAALWPTLMDYRLHPSLPLGSCSESLSALSRIFLTRLRQLRATR